MPKLILYKSHVKLRLTHLEARTLRAILNHADGARLRDETDLLALKHPSRRQAQLIAKLLMTLPSDDVLSLRSHG